jgi:hypothetical protein
MHCCFAITLDSFAGALYWRASANPSDNASPEVVYRVRGCAASFCCEAGGAKARPYFRRRSALSVPKHPMDELSARPPAGDGWRGPPPSSIAWHVAGDARRKRATYRRTFKPCLSQRFARLVRHANKRNGATDSAWTDF